MKVFVYNALLKDKIQKLTGLTPDREEIAEVRGKLIMLARTPILLNTHDIYHTKQNKKVFGAIFTYNNKFVDKIMFALDTYHASTKEKIGIVHPCAMTYQSTIIAYPIVFDNIHELETYRYQYKKGVKCIVWKGNIAHPEIKEYNTRKKITNGVYMPGMTNLLTRKGYLNDKN
jgi:hypothetical protein